MDGLVIFILNNKMYNREGRHLFVGSYTSNTIIGGGVISDSPSSSGLNSIATASSSYSLENAGSAVIYNGNSLWVRITITTSVENGPCGSIVLSKSSSSSPIIEILSNNMRCPKITIAKTISHLTGTITKNVEEILAYFTYTWEDTKITITFVDTTGGNYAGTYKISVYTDI